MMWTLCLTNNSKGRKVVKLDPSVTLEELYQVADQQYHGSKTVSLKYGFPPKLLERTSSIAITDKLQNQERIQVELEQRANSSGDVGGTAKKTNTASNGSNGNTASNTRKSKRVAAERATKNMPAIIKAQTDIMKAQQSSTASGKRQRKAPGVSSSPTKKATKSTRPKFDASVGDGRRLADGSAVSAPKNRKRPSSASKSLSGNNRETQTSDMSEALLGALNNSGKMGRVLRKGMKNAVLSSYETSRGFARLSAVQSRNFDLKLNGSSLTVTFQGVIDKAKIEECVDYIPRDVLESVLKGIYSSNMEALRAENLSLLSPRVFWSLVNLFPSHQTIDEMYLELFPDFDWVFLRRRAQQLSEKALENMRQQQEDNNDEEQDGRQAMEAVAAVEHAMENLNNYTAADRKARQAQAAMNRLQQKNKQVKAEWQLVTPSEPDRSELVACINSYEHGESEQFIEDLVQRMMKESQIRNWRELANVRDAAVVAKKLERPIIEVQCWIDHAQGESVDEIIVEICDGNVQAVELLTLKARSGSPKDLAAWRSIPMLLHQKLTTNGDYVMKEIPNADQLQTWSHRAHKLLQQYQWLNWYATPVM